MDLSLISLTTVMTTVLSSWLFIIHTCFFVLTDYPIFMNLLSQYVMPGDI